MNRQRPYLSANPARRRAKRIGLTVAMCGLMALVLSAGVVASSSTHGLPDEADVKAAVQDAKSMFAKRSPGRRGLGALLQTKIPAFAKTAMDRPAPPRKPTAATEAPVTESHPTLDEPLPLALVEAPTPFEGSAVALDLPVIQSLSSPPPQVLGGGPGGVIDGWTPPETPGGPGGIVPESLISPIPEPETWAMMILGFFGIGLGLRVRIRRRESGAGRDERLAHGLRS